MTEKAGYDKCFLCGAEGHLIVGRRKWAEPYSDEVFFICARCLISYPPCTEGSSIWTDDGLISGPVPERKVKT